MMGNVFRRIVIKSFSDVFVKIVPVVLNAHLTVIQYSFAIVFYDVVQRRPIQVTKKKVKCVTFILFSEAIVSNRPKIVSFVSAPRCLIVIMFIFSILVAASKT